MNLNRVRYYTKEEALAAVRKNGDSLGFCSTKLQDNYDVVYAAIQNQGSIHSASHRLQNDASLVALYCEKQKNNLDPYCCDFVEIIYGTKNDKKLLNYFRNVFADWEEFNLEMKLFYGEDYDSPINEYNNLSQEELTQHLLSYRKQMVENCLEVYKKTRKGPYSYESIKHNRRLSQSIRHRTLRWGITSWEKVEKPASYIIDMLNSENSRIKKWISETSEKTGGSYPERFMHSVLEVMGIDFSREQVFPWSKGKRYDFYIPNQNAIIEVHGAQHYEGGFEALGGQDLEYESKNDKEKERLAKANGISRYIVINAMSSSFNYIKSSICNNTIFCYTFNIENIDWEKVALLIDSMQKPIELPLYEAKINYNHILIELFNNAINTTSHTMSAPQKTSSMLFFDNCYPSKNGLKPHEIILLERASTFQAENIPEHIAKKWYIHFHENITEKINHFIAEEFLCIGDITKKINKVSVPILKKVLLELGFDATGKKEDIINRLLKNISPQKLNEYIPIKFYELTQKGKDELTANKYLFCYERLALKSRIRIVNSRPNVQHDYLFEDFFKHPNRYANCLEENDYTWFITLQNH